MRLPSHMLSKLLSLLLGAAWAVAFIGAARGLFSELHGGNAISAFFSMAIWMLPGLLLVVLAEYFFAFFEKCEELKRQTELLEKIEKNTNTVQYSS